MCPRFVRGFTVLPSYWWLDGGKAGNREEGLTGSFSLLLVVNLDWTGGKTDQNNCQTEVKGDFLVVLTILGNPACGIQLQHGFSAVHYSAVHYSAVQCSQCTALHCTAVQYSAVNTVQ